MVKDTTNNKSSQVVVAKTVVDEEMEYVGSKEGSQQGLKKGPWTTTEDAILIEYVKKHGEGNWNSVQKNSGLMRCGKSCRLRWANHLRPNLKKGSFTPEEERLIIHLHSKIGNKWARMASQLPGRTDNEIKNFWNTRMKRQQRAGLPLYPNEFQESTSAFQLHHHHRRHQQKEQHKHNPNSQASSQTSFLSSSSHNQKITNSNYNHSLSSIFSPKIMSSHSIDPFQNHLASSFDPNQTQFKFYSDVNANNGSSTMALYPRLPSCTSIFNQNLMGQALPTPPLEPLQSLHYNGFEFDENVSFTSLIMGGHVGPIGIIPGLNSEIPHDRTPPQPATPLPISSNTNDVGGACDIDAQNQKTSNDQEMGEPVIESDGNSGLLDALLHQSKHMAQKEKFNKENIPILAELDHKGKEVMKNELKEEEEEKEDEIAKDIELRMRNGSEVSSENQCDEMSFSQSSTGYGGMTNPSEEHIEQMNSMDDDLLSLLNFPSSTPPPDWYQQTRNSSNGSLSIAHDNGGLKIEQDSSSDNPTATENTPPELQCALGSYYWNNMPNICEEHPHQDLHVLQGN